MKKFSNQGQWRYLVSAHRLRFLLAFLMLASALLPAAWGQLSGKGAVAGTVLDPSGAAVPNAVIVITNNADGIATTATSASDGDFSISTLDPGVYTVVVSARGFESLTQKDVQVNALETQTLNPRLTVGASGQTVTVSAAPPQLETTNAVLGATMDNEMYSALPLAMGAGGNPDQRRATDFSALMPGVQANETNGNSTDNVGVIDGTGSRGAASAVYIDGVDFTNASGEGDPRFIWTAISVDAVNQFQVQTAGYSALYEGQGVLNFTVKQGGDQYHGAAYEFFRNTALDTWGFFKVTSGITGQLVKPVEHQNEYGILLSGPLLPLPRWRDKIFAFANYNAYRYSEVTPSYVTFPNAAEQAGNFSSVEPIYDPNTQASCTAFYGSQCRYRYGYKAGASPGSAPVLSGAPVDQIPASEMSAIALKLQSYIPALSNQSLGNNYIAPNPSGLVNWSTTDRIDYIVSPKNTLSLVAALGRQASSFPVGQTTAGRNTASVPYNYGQAYAPKTAVGVIEDTETFSERLVNQFKYGFGRYDGADFNVDSIPAYSATALGITGLPAGQAAESFPTVSFSGVDTPTQWAGYAGSITIANSYFLIDNLLWVHKNHNITFGAELGWLEYQDTADTGGSSPVTLSNAVTETAGFENATTLAPSTGDAYASFLLGQIDKYSFTQNVVPETGARFHPISPYVQDNWRVNSRLTLDLGLRYDDYPSYRESHDVLSFFNPTLTNPVTGSPGAIEYAGKGANTCDCSSLVNNYYKNFGPRLGFAFLSSPKTVWRGSWGVMYTHGNAVGGAAISRTGTGTLGFSASPSIASSTSTYLSAAPLGAFPAYTPASGVASGNAYGTGYTTTAGYTGSPSTVGYGDPYYGGRAPQYINWSFGFQHQWTGSLTSSISYVASQGHFLITDGGNPRGYWADALSPQYLSLGSCLGSAVSKLSAACIAEDPIATPSWFNTSTALSQLLKPFPQYGLSDSYGNVANSNYNALQATLIQRPANGITFMLNYTWSKTIDDGGTFRTGYPIPAAVSNTGKSWAADRIERGVSTSNQPQKAVFTGVWNLPFGAGNLGGGNRYSRAVLGGFKLSGIFQAYSGSPLAFTASSGQTNPAVSTVEPMLNPGFINGSARVNGKWGKGITYSNPSAISYIAPSTCSTSTAPTGPFINPVAPSGQTTCLNTQYAPAYTFGNAPRTAPFDLYGPGNYDVDLSLRRSFKLHLTESSRLNFQADLYNVTNHVQFGGIGTSVGSSTLGTVSSQANTTRAAQLSGRVEF